MKFYIKSQFAELLDLALYLQDVEKQEVIFDITESDYKNVGNGLLKKDSMWWNYVGEKTVFVVDGCVDGNLQEWLRSRGELVVGGSEKGDKLENDRQMGQEWFKSAGFKQPQSKNFKSIDDAMAFVQENADRRWILKQNGDAPKSINHMGKFPGSEDMIFHLEELKSKWNAAEYGEFDCDLMEIVEGLEVAASVFFNGTNFLKNKDGKVVGFLNFEEKKEVDGGLGETTGEMGTLFMGVTEDNPLFRDMIMKPKIIEVLRKINFRGVFDINCIKTKDGIVALEPTMRFGIPATSYEFIEGMNTPTHELLAILAEGRDDPIDIKMGWGMVMVVAAKPYPVESDIEDKATSLGERLWILQDGKPIEDFTPEQRQHIHLENFQFKDDYYCVASKNGYLLTVTGTGTNIKDTREKLIEYIKKNLYISGMKFRMDIGKRVEDAMGVVYNEKEAVQKVEQDREKEKNDIKVALSKKEQELEAKKQKEIEDIKIKLRKSIYG